MQLLVLVIERKNVHKKLWKDLIVNSNVEMLGQDEGEESADDNCEIAGKCLFTYKEMANYLICCFIHLVGTIHENLLKLPSSLNYSKNTICDWICPCNSDIRIILF